MVRRRAEGGDAASGRVAEAELVDALRADPAWLPELSLVATAPRDETAIIGHVPATRGHVDTVPALALGPLSVHPEHQGAGAGKALVHALLGAADALGEPLVAVLGAPQYYGRFGFRPAADYGIAPAVPEWRARFQVRTLTYHRSVRGTFHHAEPFHRV